MTTSKKILRNFSFLLGADLITKALGFISVIYLARVLTVEGFGKIEFAQAIIIYFVLLVNQGLDLWGVREIAKGQEKIKEIVNNVLSIRFFLSLLAYGLLVIFVLLINKPWDIKQLILIYGLSIFTFSFTLNWFFQGIERMEFIALGQLMNQLLYVGGIFIVVKNSSYVFQVPLIKVIAAFFSLCLLALLFFKLNGSFKLSLNPSAWKEIFKQSLPMGFSLVVIQIYYNLDTIMLGFMKGVTVVGWYNAAYKIVLVFVGFASLFGTAVFPVLSRCYKESLDQFRKFVLQFSRLTIFFGLPIAVGGTILSDQIIRFVYGSAYQSSILPLQILIWSVFTVYFNCSFAFCLLASDRQKEYMYSVLIGAVVNLTLNLILIPKYSMLGASIATIVCEVVTLGLILFYSGRIVKSIPWIDLLKVLGSSSLMGLVLYSLSGNLLIKVFIGMAVYLGAMIILRGIHREDVIWLKQIIRAPHE
ncbi:MAG: flippase [candidate division Zixibacteria bacterium]|nr:flippase [candidate division Zixibacteria bacterium]